jgi:single-stranded DNA-binding protein
MANKNYPKVNSVILTGHITMEPKETETKNGRRMASFSLGQPDVLSPDTPTYHQCIAWNNAEGYGPASFILDVANKPGTELTIIGKLLQKLEEVELKDGTTRKIRTTSILVEQVFFAGSARRSEESTETASDAEANPKAPSAPRKGSAAPTSRPGRSTPVVVADDDLPF